LFTDVGGTLYFTANVFDGFVLWKSDGTETGTVMVKDLWPGAAMDVAGTLYFTADDNVYGWSLWKSDGTEAGTALVKGTEAGSGFANWVLPASVGGELYFIAFTYHAHTYSYELWKSDATGTVKVRDMPPTPDGLAPGSLTNVAGTLYFRAKERHERYALWRSDGTESGTVKVKDIWPRALTDVAGTLYFTAKQSPHGYGLWKSDGTKGGTVLVKRIGPNAASRPQALTDVGGTLYFAADDGTHGMELWKSDGTEPGTVMVSDLSRGANGSDPTWITDVGGVVFFAAEGPAIGRELWSVAS
jgi:ELWxxDGT repeat protein